MRHSCKRVTKKKSTMGKSCGENVIMLQAVCPTRWCIRATTLNRAENNYKNIQNFLLDLLNDSSLRATTKATVKSLLKQSGKASTLFGIKIAGDIFGVCEPVARSLQRPGTTAGDCLKLIEKLKNSLSKMRREKVFEKYFDEVSSSDLVKMPNISRSKNTPLRFRQTTTTEEVALSVTDV
ncbi:Hypothetical predicted protein [Octopus vulgaris]|uniref:Uncharacterized protein n=1 Tax=Octopus vulgaris TaxID=6645 RepID=A0AA36BMR5_OCTVU|nr:Hypothetical predicted protein [Octopus vulgaris]